MKPSLSTLKGVAESSIRFIAKNLRLFFPEATPEEVWTLLTNALAMDKPGGFCGVCRIQMDATPSTVVYPDCNTWTCPKCGCVEPETGSQRD